MSDSSATGSCLYPMECAGCAKAPVTAGEGSTLSCVFHSEILVVGLARNCGESVSSSISVIQRALKRFRKVSWLVIESDSDDSTVDVLRRIECDVDGFGFISLGALKDSFPLRTDRIARCRNKYLEELENNPSYSEVDFLVVSDLDGVSEKFTEDAFLSCWSRTGWGGCTANQNGPYYDIYALRHPAWCPGDALRQSEFLAAYMDNEDAMSIAIRSKMIKIPADSEWIEVESAFGGLAVYKKESVLGARYNGLDDRGREVCEHVDFHRMIRSKGFGVYINPRLINSDYNEHSLRYGLSARIKRRLIVLLKKILGRR